MKFLIFLGLFAISRVGSTLENENSEEFFLGLEDGAIYEDKLKNDTEDGSVMKINKNWVNKMMSERMLAGKVENDHLVDLLKVYDVGNIGKSWYRNIKYFTTGCRRNMHIYLSALDKSELWALKGELINKKIFFEIFEGFQKF